jgi:citrate lyase beta subunit
MEAPLTHRPFTTTEVAQARLIVTHFDQIIDENGTIEAAELRGTAWDILLADHAARLLARRRARLGHTGPTTGDAA